MDDYYKLLDIPVDATEDLIKKNFRKLAMKYHPDKAPTELKDEYTQQFQKISEAYEVLADPQKRKIYNTSGHEGLKNAAQNQSQPSPNVFWQNNLRKNQDTTFTLSLTLKDAFLGTTKKLKITKKVIMYKKTKGIVTTNLENTWTKCNLCNGQGVFLQQLQIGNGMAQLIQQQCKICSGTGACLLNDYIISEVSDILTFNIQKGVLNNEQFRLPNQGNCSPGLLPGDIIITMHVEQSAKGFTRNGNDLHYTQPLLLVEALCGGNFQINTLDDKILNVNILSIKPGETKTISNLGINGGNLIITFNIVFPELDSSQKEKIIQILGSSPILKN
jgi:DnaJ family protein A protein 2